jgi:hypothetical protein
MNHFVVKDCSLLVAALRFVLKIISHYALPLTLS